MTNISTRCSFKDNLTAGSRRVAVALLSYDVSPCNPPEWPMTWQTRLPDLTGDAIGRLDPTVAGNSMFVISLEGPRRGVTMDC